MDLSQNLFLWLCHSGLVNPRSQNRLQPQTPPSSNHCTCLYSPIFDPSCCSNTCLFYLLPATRVCDPESWKPCEITGIKLSHDKRVVQGWKRGVGTTCSQKLVFLFAFSHMYILVAEDLGHCGNHEADAAPKSKTPKKT